MARRTWYEKYIGYCFTDNGQEVILEDVFYWEDENGRNKRTGYQLFYPATGRTVMTDYSGFMQIRKQTCLPR